MQIQKSFNETSNGEGKLYLVPTPIGNLEDMTFRAISTLKEVDKILAEDTRQSQKLMKYYEIETPMHSFHEFTSVHQVKQWVDYLKSGHSIALISDAGMPLINDPGHPLVQSALESSLSVISLPGANAALTALISSGLPANQFSYYGFFPRSNKDQLEILDQISQRKETAIFYESPYRVHKTISKIREILGDDVLLVIAREISKKFEEYIRGSASELEEYLEKQPLKGECVLLVNGGSEIKQHKRVVDDSLSYKDQVLGLMDEEGLSAKEAIKQIAQYHQVRKQIIYAAFHELDQESK
ncbi:16S rRNA (cytidine(1402)-2'-O)-methyltransferase [Facklamia sp. DSM 111018]|uniref:Ribosomal RNA small subunit methyltransferase I n=1 Tax=Facklamia lactis TaxID=2749967 RepID=A0ABS0LUI7_9LACT|nr:16S rRNA (cytidine(1402)-2'-O)-methyltransferase [Facklamia lactis]MBG9981389.1 16S rRNA (cytidine(1402)-2'-O)-methyltransferase [Facklamia lactis]MBG9987135.1 16S rRNA (cytidine(1402)-2'-O)-methyltransferase [Facklamia lactis]